ncbi:MAG: hypothetical protein H0U50_10395 [Pyrinomonadaceae bacterium]|nr:hypothetical protein [Pyrinomonadaceae bacterium]
MENSAEIQAELEKRYRATAFIVAGQIALTIIFIIAAWIVAPRFQNSASSDDLTPFWVGALFIAIGSFILRRMLFRWDRLRDIVLLKGLFGLLRDLQKNAVLLGAMAELIALIGFVIAFLSGNPYEMLRAGAIALVVFLINFPRQSVWKKIAANLENT